MHRQPPDRASPIADADRRSGLRGAAQGTTSSSTRRRRVSDLPRCVGVMTDRRDPRNPRPVRAEQRRRLGSRHDAPDLSALGHRACASRRGRRRGFRWPPNRARRSGGGGASTSSSATQQGAAEPGHQSEHRIATLRVADNTESIDVIDSAPDSGPPLLATCRAHARVPSPRWPLPAPAVGHRVLLRDADSEMQAPGAVPVEVGAAEYLGGGATETSVAAATATTIPLGLNRPPIGWKSPGARATGLRAQLGAAPDLCVPAAGADLLPSAVERDWPTTQTHLIPVGATVGQQGGSQLRAASPWTLSNDR